MTTEFVLDTWIDGPRLKALDLGVYGDRGWHAVGVTPSALEAFIREAEACDPNGTWSGCEVTDDVNGLVLSDGNDPEDGDLDMFLPVLDADTVEAAGGDPSLRMTGGEAIYRFDEWTFIPVSTVAAWEV